MSSKTTSTRGPDWTISCATCGSKHSAEKWQRLTFVGVMNLGTGALEMRQCECGNTLGMSLAEPGNLPPSR